MYPHGRTHTPGTKPAPGQGINWSHPLAGGLFDCLLLNEMAGQNAYNYAEPRANATGTGVVWGAASDSGVLTNASATANISIPDHGNLSAGDLTIRVIWTPLTFVNSFNNIFSKGGASREESLFMSASGVINFCTVGTGQVSLSPAVPLAMVSGQRYDIVLTRNQSLAGLSSVYINGVFQSSGTDTATGAVTSPLDLGGAGGTNSTKAVYHHFAAWRGRALTAQEVRWLYEEPYAMFLPLRPVRSYSVASAAFQAAWARGANRLISGGVSGG